MGMHPDDYRDSYTTLLSSLVTYVANRHKDVYVVNEDDRYVHDYCFNMLKQVSRTEAKFREFAIAPLFDLTQIYVAIHEYQKRPSPETLEALRLEVQCKVAEDGAR